MTDARAGVADRASLLARGRSRRVVRRTDAHSLAAGDDLTVSLDSVPDPYTTSEEGPLSVRERADLETCERAVEGLRRALVVAGKALATIHQARLYRETHGSFEAYVEERWGMKRAHAYRLMKAWPVAAALAPTGEVPEAQVRELVPAAERHGVETAKILYEELRTRPGRVTAALIRQTVRHLPDQLGDPDEVREAVRVAAAPLGTRDGEGEDSALAALAVVLDRQMRLYDALGGGLIERARRVDPDRAEDLLDKIGQFASRTVHRVRR